MEKTRLLSLAVVAMIGMVSFLPLVSPSSINVNENTNSPEINENNVTPSGWSEDVRLSYSGNGYRPAIATKGNVIHTAWENRSDTYEISYSRSFDNGRTWESERVVTNSSVSGTCYFPDISINNSTVHMVYSDDRDAGRIETYYLKSTDGGDTWSEAIMLTDSNLSYSQQARIASWNDNVYVVWLDERDGGPWEIYYKNSSDGGDTWSIDRRLTFTAPDSFGNVDIKVNDTNLHIAFCMRTGTPYVFEIFYMNSTDGGISWSTPTMVSQANDAHSQDTSLAINGSDIHIVWRDSKTGSYDIFYRNSTDGGISFNPEVRLTDSPDWETKPSIFAENNNLSVVFSDDRDQPGTGSDIYMKNSTDGGISWTADTRLTFTATDEYALNAKIDENNGTTHILWMDQRDVSSYEIYYKRYPDFPADATHPSIIHTTITGTPIGLPINISCQVSDNVALGGVWLNYTGVNGTNYNISMTGWNQKEVMVSGLGATLYAQDGNYSFEIPAQDSAGVLSYYIWAEDVYGNIATSPWGGSHFVQITGPPSIEITNPSGGEDWTGGSIHPIEFLASDVEDNQENLTVFLNYSYNGGTITGTINQTAGDGSPESWTLPILNATDVEINATVVDSDGNKAYDDSLEFTIDSSSPEVVSTNPVNNTTGISIFQPIVIQFNEPMNISSVVVNQTNGANPGNWQWFWNEAKDNITGTHNAWSRGDSIEITVQAGYTDDSNSGNANNTAYAFSFTTETNPLPEIVHTNISGPHELGDIIRINATIIDDSEVINAVLWWQDVDDVWHENYMDKNGNNWEYLIPGQMIEEKVRYQINATDDLGQKNTTMIYEFDIEDTTAPVIVHTPVKSALIGEMINITCQATDLSGVDVVYFYYKNESAVNFTQVTMDTGYWYEISGQSEIIDYYIEAFDIYGNDARTQVYSLEIIDPSVPDTTPLEVLLATPTGDDIPISTDISIVFSEAVNQTSVEDAISVSPTLTGISYTWLDDQTLVLSFDDLQNNTTYTVSIDTSAKDLAGNTLDNDYTYEFTTAEEPEIVQPPASNDWGWIGIIILLITIIILMLFYQSNKGQKGKEEKAQQP